MTSTQRCPLTDKKHRYEWTHDITVRKERHGPRGSTITLSKRGEYKCACGLKKLGIARGGL